MVGPSSQTSDVRVLKTPSVENNRTGGVVVQNFSFFKFDFQPFELTGNPTRPRLPDELAEPGKYAVFNVAVYVGRGCTA